MRLRIYVAVWLIAIAAVVTLRFFVVQSADDRFPLMVGFMIATWGSVMALAIYEDRRLMLVLRRHDPARWEELRRSDLGTRAWRLKSLDSNDPENAEAVREYRAFHRFTLIVFCSYFVVVPVLMF
jgi:hypothetical protein